MSVIPDCLRSAIVSSPLGDLLFTPSPDAVLYYEARVYAEGTTTPILTTKYLGVPAVEAPSGKVRVNVRTMLNALAPGNYEVLVAAIGSGGTSESAHASAYTVPLQAA